MPDPAGFAVLAVMVAVLFVPGYGVAVAAGAPRWPAVAAAPLVAYGITTVGGPLTAALGISWNLVTFLVLTVLIGLVLFGLRILLARRSGSSATSDPTVEQSLWSRRSELFMVAGVLLGVLITAVTVLRGIGSLDAVHQDWDAVFHANAVRFIMDTGNADPSALGAVVDYEALSFYYPNSFHALTAAVGGVTGADVPVLINGQILLVGGIAGLGLAVLLRRFGARLVAVVAAPVLLSAFASFPYDTLWRGPVLPFAVGIALVPAFVLLVENSLATRQPGAIVLAALGGCGLLGLQPSTAVTGIVFAVALTLYRWILAPRRIRRELLIGIGVGAATAVLAVQSLLQASGATVIAVQDWPAVESAGQAVGEMLLLNHGAAFPQYWLVALAILGVFGIQRIKALWWWLLSAAVFLGLFVLAAAYEGNLVAQLTGLWWNDRWRFAGIIVLGIAVLAAHGVVVAADALTRLAVRLPAVRGLAPSLRTASAAALVLAVFAVLSSGFYSGTNAARMAASYQGGPTVTESEREAMSVLADLVAAEDMVMNDPNDGSPWMYALDNVRPVFGHILNPLTLPGRPEGPQDLLLRFNCLDSDPAVRQIVEDNQIAYVYLASGFLRPYFERFPGLQDLDEVDSLREVWSEGGQVIYEVDVVPMEQERSSACSSSSGG